MVLERISGHLLILSLRLKKSLGFTCPGTTFLDEKKKNIWEADYRDDGHSMGTRGEQRTKGGRRRKLYERK